MGNLIISMLSALAVFAGLAGVGVVAAPFLIPDPPNIYRTSIFDLTLPEGWSCEAVGTETVCRSNAPPPYDAVIIATMKFRDAKRDTLAAYREHLQSPQTWSTRDGRTVTSRIIDIGETTIDGRTWVDATHFESEVQYYHTRYLATVTVQVGVLFTVSAHQSRFEALQPAFEKTVRSLNIYQRFDGDTSA